MQVMSWKKWQDQQQIYLQKLIKRCEKKGNGSLTMHSKQQLLKLTQKIKDRNG